MNIEVYRVRRQFSLSANSDKSRCSGCYIFSDINRNPSILFLLNSRVDELQSCEISNHSESCRPSEYSFEVEENF